MIKIPFLNSFSSNQSGGQTIKNNVLAGFGFGILLVFTFLLPFFFVPSELVTFSFAKSIFIGLIVILVFAIYLIVVLKEGWFSFPNHVAFLSVPLVVLAYLLASIFSDAPIGSFIGHGFELSTFTSILVLFGLLFLTTQLFRVRERIFYAYLAFLVSFLVLALFHLIRFVGGADILSFGYFTQAASNTIGKWSDLAVFFALGGLLAAVTVEELKLRPFMRILLYICLALSIIFLAIINIPLIWYVLGSFALVFLVYSLSSGMGVNDNKSDNNLPENSQGEGEKTVTFHPKISVLSIIILVVSVLFIVAGGFIGGLVSQVIPVSTVDVRPSWGSTITIAQETLSEDPLFGVGPNRFSTQWNLFKPEGVNLSNYWNTQFDHGIGFIPTQMITTGIVGFATWIIFLGSIVFLGVYSIFRRSVDSLTRYFLISSFFVTLFLWTMMVLYVPSITILAITFLFTGLFFATLISAELVPTKTISFFNYPRVSFAVVLVLVLLLLSAVVFGYVIAKKTVASMYFQRSAIALSEGNQDSAEQYMLQAASIGGGDVYLRSLSQIYITKADQIVNNRENEQLSESETAGFQQAFRNAIISAQQATQADETNYQNWLILGQVFQRAVEYGLTDAYDQSMEAYESAIDRNPTNPAIRLQRARLEIANGDLDRARMFIEEAREMKQNYTEAIFLLAQIEASEGNTEAAIEQTEQAALTSPQDAGLFFQLGLLRYNNTDYDEAISSFEQAISIVPQYANAKYFLGLSHYQLGNVEDAIQQFEELSEIVTENEHVQQVLSNISAGTDPFSDTQNPINEEVGSEDEPPVEEPEEGGVIEDDLQE